MEVNYTKRKLELSSEIEKLKKEIQYIIDTKKGTNSNNPEVDNNINFSEVNSDAKDNQIDLNKIKKDKIALLKQLTIEFKDIISKEKYNLKKLNEFKLVSRQIDSIEFGAAKKKNNDAIEKAKKNKELREKASKEFYNFLKKEEEYNKIDSKLLPGILFLHKDILNAYGECPYIEIKYPNELFIENNSRTADIDTYNITKYYEDKRKEWLDNKEDKGKIYYNLYNKIINKEDLNDFINEKNVLDNLLNNLILDTLNDIQKNIYIEAKNFIEEYNTITIKTKRIKEKYKVFTNNLSIIQSESNLAINEYFTLKYGIHIYINEFVKNNQTTINLYNQDLFNEYLKKYSETLELIEQKNKYVNNTLKNLKNDLFLYLSKNETCQDNTNNLKSNKKNEQIGKYYKKWSDLKQDEKNERFESFAKYYIKKLLYNENLQNETLEVDDKIDELNQLIKNSFENKEITYKDLSWNVKKGIISNIKNLEYDDENKKFYIKTNPLSVKRKSSKKTIFNKEIEKIINKEILSFVIEWISKCNIDNITEKDVENVKNECIENIKIKLKIKKINNDDKKLLISKFNEFYSVVKNNA